LKKRSLERDLDDAGVLAAVYRRFKDIGTGTTPNRAQNAKGWGVESYFPGPEAGAI